jgi:hypothetical protein
MALPSESHRLRLSANDSSRLISIDRLGRPRGKVFERRFRAHYAERLAGCQEGLEHIQGTDVALSAALEGSEGRSCSSIGAGVLAAIGLEVLGLGPFEAPTLGMTIYWVSYNAAIINGWWWWWLPPIGVIAILFTGLFLVAVGLDELANPRVRSRV